MVATRGANGDPASAAAAAVRGQRLRRPEGAAITRDRNLRLEYLAGMGMDENRAQRTFAHMVAHGVGFPADLLAGPAPLMDRLRSTIAEKFGR